MKVLTVLVTMAVLFPGQIAEQSHWKHYPGAIEVSGALIWRVNRAEMMTDSQPLLLLNEAQFSQHKEIKDRNDLVFKEKSTVRIKAAQAVADAKTGQSANEINVIKRLTELGVKIPSEGVIFKTKTPLGKAEELVASLESPDAPVRQWNLLGSSLLKLPDGEKEDKDNPKVVPVPDYSVMIELGHRTAIEKVHSSMLVSRSNTPNDVGISEAAIYNRHFFKVPLRLDIYGSASDAGAEEEAQTIASADPVYLVRPRQEKGGYLIFGTTAEKDSGRQIVALEVAKFDVTEANGVQNISVQIPAECFLKNVIQSTVRGKASLKLMDFSSADTPAGTKKHFVQNDGSKDWMLKLDFSVANTTLPSSDPDAAPPAPDAAAGVRFLLDAGDTDTEENGMSYSASITQVPDAQIPYQDHLIRIYDKTCTEVQRKNPKLGPANATAATAKKQE